MCTQPHIRVRDIGSPSVTTLRVFRLHLSVLLPCEWWGRRFLNHSNIEAVLNKRQPGDSPRKTKQALHQFSPMFQLVQVVMPGKKSKVRGRKVITEPEPQLEVGVMNDDEPDVNRSRDAHTNGVFFSLFAVFSVDEVRLLPPAPSCCRACICS